MRLMLNMIVKNEGARIERMLRSVAPFISSWVIVDTGSTDDTKQKIYDFFKWHDIPGEIRDEPFHDWSQARNAALNWARKLNFAYQADYFLLADADMELTVHDIRQFLGQISGPSYDMYQRGGSVEYQNRRLVAASSVGSYVGVTHEFLDIESAGFVPLTTAFFVDHADGANRPEKFKRDIRLLKEGLKKEPNNVRYFFYLANSYRDAGKPEKAAKWFKRRVEAGGWEEEVWQAQVNYAHCMKDMGDEAEFIRNLLIAYNMRPSRAESMYDLARYFREKGMNAPAVACAEAVVGLPVSTDALFVNRFVYEVGVKEELSIASFYVPGKMEQGRRMNNWLALQQDYQGAREGARNNLYHYAFPLSERCPSFEWKTVNFTPPPDWIALNPSVAIFNNALYCNVRCVNYRIDEHGGYHIRGLEDGTITNANPINTRNFTLYMGGDPFTETHPWEYEVMKPADLPVNYHLVIGFEDIRLYPVGEKLLCTASVRQFHSDGLPEQVLSEVTPIKAVGRPIAQHEQINRMLREPRECQKNWSPIIGSAEPTFMYRPGEVVNHHGRTIVKHASKGVDLNGLCGSSQVIPFFDGYLAIVHEARPRPGSTKRWYWHRFVMYNQDFSVRQVSLPFYFNEKEIEFCAGMCWHPANKDKLVISYGFKDEDARIATVNAAEVMAFLWS